MNAGRVSFTATVGYHSKTAKIKRPTSSQSESAAQVDSKPSQQPASGPQPPTAKGNALGLARMDEVSFFPTVNYSKATKIRGRRPKSQSPSRNRIRKGQSLSR